MQPPNSSGLSHSKDVWADLPDQLYGTTVDEVVLISFDKAFNARYSGAHLSDTDTDRPFALATVRRDGTLKTGVGDFNNYNRVYTQDNLPKAPKKGQMSRTMGRYLAQLEQQGILFSDEQKARFKDVRNPQSQAVYHILTGNMGEKVTFTGISSEHETLLQNAWKLQQEKLHGHIRTYTPQVLQGGRSLPLYVDGVFGRYNINRMGKGMSKTIFFPKSAEDQDKGHRLFTKIATQHNMARKQEKSKLFTLKSAKLTQVSLKKLEQKIEETQYWENQAKTIALGEVEKARQKNVEKRRQDFAQGHMTLASVSGHLADAYEQTTSNAENSVESDTQAKLKPPKPRPAVSSNLEYDIDDRTDADGNLLSPEQANQRAEAKLQEPQDNLPRQGILRRKMAIDETYNPDASAYLSGTGSSNISEQNADDLLQSMRDKTKQQINEAQQSNEHQLDHDTLTDL